MGSGSFFGAVLPRRQELFSSGAPSSYIVSTPEDMAKYLSFLAGPEKLKRPPVYPWAVRSLFEPLEGVSGYAYGWRIEGKGKELSAAHSGSLEAFSASAALWPARRSGIIILAPQNSLLQSLVAMLPINDNIVKSSVEQIKEKATTEHTEGENRRGILSLRILFSPCALWWNCEMKDNHV